VAGSDRIIPGPRSFATPAAFRAWLTKQHGTAKELLVRCFKVDAAHRGITYVQAVDEALCFGWIDGVRRSIDEHSFSQRFTPRKAKSYWSAVNIRKAEALVAAGRMAAPGRAAFEARDQVAKRKYSFESKPQTFAPRYLKRIRANPKAFEFFKTRPPGYVRTHAFWVTSPANETTRLRRLETMIACWQRGEAAPPLARMKKPAAP
jgi:uncharacterized protein YdeI (YjbR/CyaY-like superfamily)